MTFINDKLFYSLLVLLLMIIRPYCVANVDHEFTSNSTSHIYTFAESNSFLQIETDDVWSIEQTREVNFIFRTNRPHGLLMYHTIVNPPPGFPIYELYVMLENGRLKVVHEFGQEQKSFYIGQGLNHDKYHQVNLFIDPTTGKLVAFLDKLPEKSIILRSLASYFDKPKEIEISFVMYFGGTDQKNPIFHQQYEITRFIGCLGKIKFLKKSKNSFILPNSKNQQQFQHQNQQHQQHQQQHQQHQQHQQQRMEYVLIKNLQDLKLNCTNKCNELNLCSYNSRCVNHYTYTSCDCFGTEREDWHCHSLNITHLTLRGYSYVSYKIYHYRNKVHSDINRIGLHFKTSVKEAILLYANGEHLKHNHIAVTLYQGKLYFEIDLGDGPVETSFNNILSDDKWHNLTIKHYHNKIKLIIDESTISIVDLPGSHHHLHVDPEIFFAGISSFRLNDQLSKLKIPFDISWKFVGCLKSIYFNTINILFELYNGNKAAQYHSLFAPEFQCSTIEPLPLTFNAENSYFISKTQSYNLKLSFEFKTEQNNAVIASGFIKNLLESKDYLWILHIKNSIANFSIYHSSDLVWNLTNKVIYLKNYWQHMSIDINHNGDVTIVSNYKISKSNSWDQLRNSYYENVYFGTSINESLKLIGFRGCVRDLVINDFPIDARYIVSNHTLKKGKIGLDNCQLVNPCDNPNVCEHGGKCIPLLKTGETICNCEKTGYIGKTCHFTLFKRSCEELFLSGYRQTGTYIIDIDRNGPLPPAHVICLMSQDTAIQTIIEHNMQRQMVVRERGKEGNFYLNITYREFDVKMLNHLIMNSEQCSQYIKYECNQAPLSLTSYTVIQTAYPKHRVTNIGSTIPGRCRCSTGKNCQDNSKYCNCDSESDGWLHDDGLLTSPKDVGVTKMFFLQPKNLSKDSEALMILGNVSCINSNTREHEITFKTKESYLEVPGWENGEMAISFRTTASKAVLFYQAPIHYYHGYIKATLTSEMEVTFEFLVNRNSRLVIVKSNQKLNTGEWQQVWVERDVHHMRFTVNLNSEFVSLDDDDEIVPFEGPLYVGGAPKSLLLNSDVRTGFIGCLRGLVINDQVINLRKYIHRKVPNIETGCMPSCKGDLCKNNATCIELWGSYECKCSNPIAHSGKQCEIKFNTNGLTFITPSSYFMQLDDGRSVNPILEKNILISFRTYMKNALIFYANDYRNNFVQLHIENGTHVVFTFNSFDNVVRGAVDVKNELITGANIQIKIDRIQRTKTIFIVNSAARIIDYPIKFLTKYSQKPWRSGEEYELVKPARPPVPIEAHSQLFLGGVDEVGTSSKIQGIVGCLQGFVIDGVQFDLEAVAKSPSIVATGQIKPGCKMLCDKQPCSNGGICSEDWKNNKTLCNCTMTSYIGENCKKDVGARFNGQSIVQYKFNLERNIYLDNVSIHFAFSTNRSPEKHEKTLLLVYYATTSSYIHFALNTDGSLFFEENTGTEKIGILSSNKISLTDGHRHFIIYKRNNNEATLIIDFKSYQTFAESETAFNKFNDLFLENVVFVGGTNRKENLDNFEGCISNIMIELNEFKIEPLESAFGGKSDIKQVKVFGEIKQGICSKFNVQAPVVALKTYESPKKIISEQWSFTPPVLTPFKTQQLLPKSGGMKNKMTVLIVSLSFLFIVMLFLGIYMLKLQKAYKIKKFQGDTPFFHSKRNSASRELKFSISNDDSDAAVKLLQHQKYSLTNNSEGHQMKELKRTPDKVTSPLLNNEYDANETSPNQPKNESAEEMSQTIVPNGKHRISFDSNKEYVRELSWDPNEENADSIKMDVDEDLEKQFKRRSKAPLATMSEVNLLSAKSMESFS